MRMEKLVAVATLATAIACTTQDPPSDESTTASELHGGTPASLVGLYDSRAHFGSDLPDPMEDYVLIEPGGTAIGLPGTQHFGATQNPPTTPPAAGHVPSNAIASLLTWSMQGGCLELRMLRPIFVPSGAPAPAPAQLWVGYLRGLFQVERNHNGSWSGTADVEAVQFFGAGPCLNGLSAPPCVTRHYTGTITLTPMDPWDQAGQPHVM